MAALTEYGGAVILVSHDPHLVELVADRLWLVKDGHVMPFEDDMEGYRRRLLSERGWSAPRAAEPKPRPRKSAAGGLSPLRAEVAHCEARVAKLEKMREAIDARLANPLLYSRGDTDEIETLQKKRAEVVEAIARAEALWLTALERLEAAGERVA